MWSFDSVDAFDADKEGRHDESETHHDRRNRLRLSMPVWVVFIGWFDRKFKPEKHNSGTDNVRERFNAVRNQSKGVTQKSSHTFERRQHQI
jgi:hypothetical protein